MKCNDSMTPIYIYIYIDIIILYIYIDIIIYIYIYIMKEPNFCTIKAQELVSQELQPLIED